MMLIGWLGISKCSMDYPLMYVLIIAAVTNDKCYAVICTDGGVPVATLTQRTAELGTKQNGFKLTCDYTINSGYVLSLWRVQTTAVDFVLTYLPPSTVAAGTGYATRGLTFVDNQTVDFPDYIQSDVTKKSFTCYLALNSSTVTCTDDREQNIFALPDVTIVSTSDLANPVPLNTNVSLDITGANYLCAVTPTFSLQIGLTNILLSVSSVTNPDGFQTFTASAHFVVTKAGSITAIMECDGDKETIKGLAQINVDVPPTECDKDAALIIAIVVGVVSPSIAVIVGVITYCYCSSSKKKFAVLAAGICLVAVGFSCLVAILVVCTNVSGTSAPIALALSIIMIIGGIVLIIIGSCWEKCCNGHEDVACEPSDSGQPVGSVPLENGKPENGNPDNRDHKAAQRENVTPMCRDAVRSASSVKPEVGGSEDPLMIGKCK